MYCGQEGDRETQKRTGLRGRIHLVEVKVLVPPLQDGIVPGRSFLHRQWTREPKSEDVIEEREVLFRDQDRG